MLIDNNIIETPDFVIQSPINDWPRSVLNKICKLLLLLFLNEVSALSNTKNIVAKAHKLLNFE